jgi:hypothetical protein
MLNIMILFQVDSSSGELRTGSTLDREERSEYVLVVGVTSKRSPSWRDAAQLQIAVVDVNDNDPTFGQTCRPVEIPENAAENSFVHAVVAYDSDFGDNGRISYTLSGGEGSFTLEPETGKLFAGTLDREKKSEYDLLITATDNGESPRSTTCSIEVKVIDKNDNDPSRCNSTHTTTIQSKKSQIFTWQFSLCIFNQSGKKSQNFHLAVLYYVSYCKDLNNRHHPKTRFILDIKRCLV